MYFHCILLLFVIQASLVAKLNAEIASIPEFYYYNRISFARLNSLAELEKRYFNYNANDQGTNPTSSEGVASTNLVVGVATEACMPDLLNCSAFKGIQVSNTARLLVTKCDPDATICIIILLNVYIQRFAGGNVLSAVSVPWTDAFPVPLTACAELFFYPFGTPLFNPTHRLSDISYPSVTTWGKTKITHTEAYFRNDFEFPIQMHWLEESKGERFQGVVQPGDSWRVTTHIGHIFIARKAEPGTTTEAPGGPIVDFMVVKESSYTFSPLNRLETCELITHEHPTQHTAGVSESKLPVQFVEGRISCDDMKLRLTEFSHQVWYHKRLGLNYVQPTLVHPVTANGFEKRKLPAETYKWLKEWYEKEQPTKEAVENAVGPSMNQHIAPSGITHLTPALKAQLAEELRPILEGWYDGALKMTSIYGIR